MTNLALGMIGNCSVNALVDDKAKIVWWCLPRPDGDPVFHALLGTNGNPGDGGFAIEIEDFSHSDQHYVENTAILRTRLIASDGSAVEIDDFCPRFLSRGRVFRPAQIVRRIRPVSGRPRIRIVLRPRFHWGKMKPQITSGSNHVRFVADGQTIRLTTDAPITYIRDETFFVLERAFNLFLGPDESLTERPGTLGREFQEETEYYWKRWSLRLGLPLEWQEAVIRAAITLKLCTFEETGAIIAAATTSLPEAPYSERNWDYRFCWLRDAFFVVRALNALSDLETMENYLTYIRDIIALTKGDHIQPVFGIGMEAAITERIEELPGYLDMGPVRVGNQAHEHHQHDVYGNIVLAAAQAFFDKRLLRQGSMEDFRHLEVIGDRAYMLHNQPDAGIWELRTRARVHTSSSLMCWAALDRLAKIANQLGLSPQHWRARANEVHEKICREAWNEEAGAFVESFGGQDLDASLLLMAEVGFLPPNDPRFVSTVDRIGEKLRRGDHLFRYHAADDFGRPETAFNVCTFWFIDALGRIDDRREEAREMYETMLSCRNHLGLLSEDTDPQTNQLWGNFPQTYSMVGIINGAVRLSRRWDKVI
ncbi:glycoside hydrolase family 15 protein [Acuticoccus mangrovi]|uniref:Glycoside hydrolase family 15 protein n=1 Tax=Acuticoccus mangrovi TaxID=2796142 RepID=A0A934MF89_9HYPH|nr:glycoside hydrolase family 15 protein [Acuticoccus mangrovi]MBJ3778407.1 glycoside hydrolase family 15 protein [Acuticoccus mangrovi]